jgi:23S rRNA pseudouridine1911/1915/1917 synthase
MKTIVLSSDVTGVRLDVFLSEKMENMTRSAASQLIQQGLCLVNGKLAQKSVKLTFGDVIKVSVPAPKPATAVAEEIPLDIFYEDDDLLIVNKPKGMVVHPAAGHYNGTLVNALLAHCGDSLSGINGELKPGIVHRIDKDTSGLLMVAKNDMAHNHLAAQIKSHTFVREYRAVVNGVIKTDGTVNAPIGRHKTQRKKMCVTDYNAREAITHYQVINTYPKHTYLKLRLETGRTHQIRVHMAYLGHPVIGDAVYGNGNPKWLNGQCLHAAKVGFVHPRTNEYLEFEAPLPEYFIKLLKEIEK